jgi:hypothetical protein
VGAVFQPLLAWVLWLLCYPDQALESRARRLSETSRTSICDSSVRSIPYTHATRESRLDPVIPIQLNAAGPLFHSVLRSTQPASQQ